MGTGLSQIGEFSFVIATLGLTMGVTDPSLYPIVIGVALVTTLFTPLWIRSADGLTDGILRSAPKPLVGYLALYKDWVKRFKGGQWNSLASKLSRKWILQMAVNMALVAGVILGAAYLARLEPAWLTKWKLTPDSLRAALWGAAMVLSLPMLIANLRKLQALDAHLRGDGKAQPGGPTHAVAPRRGGQRLSHRRDNRDDPVRVAA